MPASASDTISRATLMGNVKVAVSPSMSVAVSVYIVSACAPVGVPVMVPPVVVSADRVYVSPAGSAGVRA